MTVSKTASRLSGDHERDARWYWTQAGADVFGLRAQSYEPGIVTSDAADWRRIEAAHGAIRLLERWRRIAGRLARLPHRQFLALQAYYGRAGATVVEHVGPLTAAHARWLTATGPARGPLRVRVGVEAEALLSGACASYEALQDLPEAEHALPVPAPEARREAAHRCRVGTTLHRCPCCEALEERRAA